MLLLIVPPQMSSTGTKFSGSQGGRSLNVATMLSRSLGWDETCGSLWHLGLQLHFVWLFGYLGRQIGDKFQIVRQEVGRNYRDSLGKQHPPDDFIIDGRRKSLFQVLADQMCYYGHHIFFRDTFCGDAFLCEVLIEPDLRLALAVNPNHRGCDPKGPAIPLDVLESPQGAEQQSHPLFSRQQREVTKPEGYAFRPDAVHSVAGADEWCVGCGQGRRVQDPHDVRVWLLPSHVELHLFLGAEICGYVVLLHLYASRRFKQDFAVLVEADPDPATRRLAKTESLVGIRIAHSTFQQKQMQQEDMVWAADSNCLLYIYYHFPQAMNKKYTIDDFNLLTVLGKGLYGKVFLVREVENQQVYALKVLKKSLIERKNKAHYVFSERNILVEFSHPFIIHMHAAFQNEKKLYFILEYCPGGELYSLLIRKEKFTEEQAKFYAAQILLSLQYMHDNNVVYRDLKPENVLIDREGYIRITDFGLSKKAKEKEPKDKFSAVGTPEYMAPEVLLNEETDKAMDFWAFGALIHEMVTGMPPFYCEDQNEMFEDIKFKQFKMDGPVSDQCKSLVEGLLEKNPQKRLGAKDINDIKSHSWFSTVSWEAVVAKQYRAPFVPILKNSEDVSYFESEFTESPLETYSESLPTSKANPGLFKGFTYNEPIDERAETEEEHKNS